MNKRKKETSRGDITTKLYLDTVLEYGNAVFSDNHSPPPEVVGNIWSDSSSTTTSIYDGNSWIPFTTIKNNLNDIISHIGEVDACKILYQEVVESQLRKKDSELNQLWEDYKILAKLKADYEKDLAQLLKIK